MWVDLGLSWIGRLSIFSHEVIADLVAELDSLSTKNLTTIKTTCSSTRVNVEDSAFKPLTKPGHPLLGGHHEGLGACLMI